MMEIAVLHTVANSANGFVPLGFVLVFSTLISLATSRWTQLTGGRQSRLTETEERLRRITDNMLDMICQTDVNGSVEYSSPSYQLVLGYSPEALVGQSFYSGLH